MHQTDEIAVDLELNTLHTNSSRRTRLCSIATDIELFTEYNSFFRAASRDVPQCTSTSNPAADFGRRRADIAHACTPHFNRTPREEDEALTKSQLLKLANEVHHQSYSSLINSTVATNSAPIIGTSRINQMQVVQQRIIAASLARSVKRQQIEIRSHSNLQTRFQREHVDLPQSSSPTGGRPTHHRRILSAFHAHDDHLLSHFANC